jgi:dTDP-4-amino-4,6-dideoxygalactose transaminase
MPKLAIKGGTQLRVDKFAEWPVFGAEEMLALERVLKSGIWGTLGSEVIKFASRFAEYQHADYGVAVTNGTVSLEVILRALGIGRGDEVIIPPYTFVATASSVILQGATPVFADIEDGTYNICPEAIEKAITPRTKAIIPVHIGGRPCDMDRIMKIACAYGLHVIEDCAHAPGSEWKGRRVGAFGDAGSFSFQNSKNITAGEGGCITTRNAEVYEKCWSVHNCGRDMHGRAWYGHPYIGTNARMTEWQAAVLDVQLDKLDAQIGIRMENAAYLNRRLKEIPCIEIMQADERITRNSYHLFVFKYKRNALANLPRSVFLDALNTEGIPCSPGYSCLYMQPLFSANEFRKITGSTIDYPGLRLANAEKAASEEGVWFTQNMLLGDKKDMDDIADAILKILENAEELI